MDPRNTDHDELGDPPEPEHNPDPMWALTDMDDGSLDEPGQRSIPVWVIVIAVLIALALIIQLAWPLVMDLLDRSQEPSGFPTPGPV